MFEIRCVVSDKRVGDVHKALQGLTLEPPVVVYVAELEDKLVNFQKSPKQQLNGNGVKKHTALGIIKEYLAATKTKQITSAQMRIMLTTKNYSTNAYSYALLRLLKDGSLKKSKESGIYEVQSK